MQGPGNESTIKRLLLSDELEDQIDGLTQLIDEYQDSTCRSLRSKYHWLPAEDIADAWSESIFAIWENVQNKKFCDVGSLRGYVRRIASNKVVSQIRHNAVWQIQSGLEGDRVPAAVDISGELIAELLEEIESAFVKLLDEEEQLLMSIDVYLAIQAGFKWVTIGELTAEYNRQTGQDLQDTTIRSRRWRGRIRLQQRLSERGKHS